MAIGKRDCVWHGIPQLESNTRDSREQTEIYSKIFRRNAKRVHVIQKRIPLSVQELEYIYDHRNAGWVDCWRIMIAKVSLILGWRVCTEFSFWSVVCPTGTVGVPGIRLEQSGCEQPWGTAAQLQTWSMGASVATVSRKNNFFFSRACISFICSQKRELPTGEGLRDRDYDMFWTSSIVPHSRHAPGCSLSTSIVLLRRISQPPLTELSFLYFSLFCCLSSHGENNILRFIEAPSIKIHISDTSL